MEKETFSAHWKVYIDTKRRAESLAQLRHSLDLARAYFQCTQKRYKRDFVRRLDKGRNTIGAAGNVFIDVSGGFSKAQT